MRHNTLNLSKYREEGTKPGYRYPSKLLADLMDSDSEGSDNYQPDAQPQCDLFLQEQPTQASTNKRVIEAPLLHPQKAVMQKLPKLVKKQLKYKENVFSSANLSKQSIHYNCYKLQGQKLIDHTKYQPVHSSNFNTLNLEQASLIAHDSQQPQIQCLKRQKQALQVQLQIQNQTRIKLERQIKNLNRNIQLLHEQMETKDSYYGQLDLQFVKKKEDLHRAQETVKKLSIQVKKLEQQNRKTTASKIEEENKHGMGNRYGSRGASLFAPNYNSNSIKDCSEDKSDVKYDQIIKYVRKLVEQLRDKLLQHKMSPVVAQILESFMEQLLNMNEITVARSKLRTSVDSLTPAKIMHQIHTQQTSHTQQIAYSHLIRSPISQITSKTPPKPEKSEQLRNLEKSVHKLRQLEKSYIKHTPNASKDNFESLDRSSIMALDRSGRSKSRRKKIFE